MVSSDSRVPDHYAVLKVARDASPKEVKNAYRQLARKYHPDVSTEKDAEERFKEVNEAFQTLGDSDLRRSYDGQLATGLSTEGIGQTVSSGRGVTLDDLTQGFGLENLFGGGSFFGGFGEKRSVSRGISITDNDLGLLHALIVACQSDGDGEWQVKKAESDTRDWMPTTIYEVTRKGNKVSVARRIDDWRLKADRGKRIYSEEGDELAGNEFVRETYLRGKKRIKGVPVGDRFDRYLNALESLAEKFAFGIRNEQGGYDVTGEAAAINSYNFQVQGERGDIDDFDRKREIPLASFMGELNKAGYRVIESTSGHGSEGQQARSGET